VNLLEGSTAPFVFECPGTLAQVPGVQPIERIAAPQLKCLRAPIRSDLIVLPGSRGACLADQYAESIGIKRLRREQRGVPGLVGKQPDLIPGRREHTP
jgi:hypothetical protein